MLNETNSEDFNVITQSDLLNDKIKNQEFSLLFSHYEKASDRDLLLYMLNISFTLIKDLQVIRGQFELFKKEKLNLDFLTIQKTVRDFEPEQLQRLLNHIKAILDGKHILFQDELPSQTHGV